MTKLQLYDPFRDVWNLSDEIGRLFWGLGHRRSDSDLDTSISFVPSVDIAEDNEAMTVHAELPGLKKEDVKIKIREGVLTLSGEKKFKEEKKKDKYYCVETQYGTFARSFTLPKSVDPDKIEASMKDGILHLRIPKKPEAKEREIDIKVQ